MRFERENAAALHLPPDHVAALDRAFAQAAQGRCFNLRFGSRAKLTVPVRYRQLRTGHLRNYPHLNPSSRGTNLLTTMTALRLNSPISPIRVPSQHRHLNRT